MSEQIDWKGLVFWLVIICLSLGIWAGIGYGISLAFADSKHKRFTVHCSESKPRPHIGTAIVCTSVG